MKDLINRFLFWWRTRGRHSFERAIPGIERGVRFPRWKCRRCGYEFKGGGHDWGLVAPPAGVMEGCQR